MALKGEVCIELKNVETGEVERIEGHNRVTNAVEKFINLLGPFVGGYYNCNSYALNNFFPISENLYSGLLLFEDAINENTTNYDTLNKNLKCIAGNYGSSNVLNGSYNEAESGKTETGYKHVWDFTTSQCNGRISALSLTHKYGVNSIYYNSASRWSEVNQPQVITSLARFSTHQSGHWAFLHYDEITQEVYMLNYNTNDRLFRIYKRYFPLTHFTLNDKSPREPAYFDEDSLNILVSTFSPQISVPNYCSSHPVSYDGDNNRIYFAIGINKSSRLVTYAEVNMVSWEITEHSVTLPDISSQHSGTYTFTGYYGAGDDDYGTVAFKDGYGYFLYFSNNSTDSIYPCTLVKVNLSDPTDYVLIDDSILSTVKYGAHICTITGLGVAVYTGGDSGRYPVGLFSRNNTIYKLVNTDSSFEDISISKSGLIHCSESNLSLNFRYLGTIFNLPSPITKTAAQTMKIIYTLTDAS